MSADYDTAGFVVSSSYRVSVIEQLADRPATPSTLSEATGLEIAHISRALSDLREEGLVELLVSEERKKGRIYGLTDGGEEILGTLATLGEVEA